MTFDYDDDDNANSSEHGSKHVVSTKSGSCFARLTNCQCLKYDFTPWSLVS